MSDPKRVGLILEIQQDAISKNRDVSSLLRKTKVAAVKLKQHDAISWINSELDGYDCSYDELPNYRKAHGILKAKNPYHGLVPYFIENDETEELLTRTPFFEGVGTLEKLLAGQDKGSILHYSLSSAARNLLIKSMDIAMEPILLVSYSQIETILNKVTSLVLDWALELEANGILGDGMTFSTDDEKRASEVTQTIIAQNIGTVGNTSEGATTNIEIASSGTQQIDQRKLSGLLAQARQASELLPVEMREETLGLLSQIENAKSDEDKRNGLNSLKNVLEGATGNIAAQGIIQLISTLL